MNFKADIGIIGAMTDEVEAIIGMLENRQTDTFSGIAFNYGTLLGKRVVVAQCGVGKVFAALCCECMIIKYSPALIVNTGVGGALDSSLRPLDVCFADKLVQHDMDTSPLGDPKGLISGVNRIYFDTDARALELLRASAEELGVNYLVGTVATGDRFVCDFADKKNIKDSFAAVACEMEGGAIAHVCYVNSTPFAVVRAISDSADGDASMDYLAFLPRAVKTSVALTLSLIEKY